MTTDISPCLKLNDLRNTTVESLIRRHGLSMNLLPDLSPIPGSYWGPPEAGLLCYTIQARKDTPVHSLLHELAHVICMDETRRRHLNTDAQGTEIEECAVCYLQVLLADELPEVGRDRLMCDMDSWGYSFRLGTTRLWFTHDADDARSWLISHGLINEQETPLFRLRT